MTEPPNDWSWGVQRIPPDLEGGGGASDGNNPNNNIRSPMPIRVNQDSEGKLAPPRSPSTPPFEPGYFQKFTRPASPLVNGQTDRRPLTMGNPAVIGLWSFATVTILLGCFKLFVPWKSNHAIYPTALLFGGIAQYIAGFLDLFYGGTFSGTILVSYGAFWAGQGMMMLPTASAVLNDYVDEADISQGMSIYNFIWAFYTLMLLCLSFQIRTGNFILSWCLFWVFLTLLFDGVFYLTNNQPLLRTSGVTAILAALGAYYSGVAAVMEEQRRRMWVGKYKWQRNKKHHWAWGSKRAE
ncbi:GPR1/FUN34/yaaH family-domain-containing protein [Syncephalastrum racemosum]|uniref:GPR1/FUN34/yaaH family-domain-containing protein n=1 Tax=Syncephalastrum racemosum TaxID=13706 RepID=A0A1X2HW67_SYNRA|nr:GPR1/FUN34/yaaH family-domain-containing protein [Syncephalastrum racemosum]